MRFVSAIVFIALSAVVPSCAQDLRVTEDPFGKAVAFRAKWDRVLGVLYMIRGCTRSAAQTAAVYNQAGSVSYVVSTCRDFPDAETFHLADAAMRPDGGIALTGILDFGEKSIRSVLLQYGPAGDLKEVWDVAPYVHKKVWVSSSGAVFAFGFRNDVRHASLETDYPLLIKYSAAGEVERTAMPWSLFGTDPGPEVARQGPDVGEHQLLGTDSKLYLYVAPLRTVFSFDHSLNQTGKYSVLDRLPDSLKSFRDASFEVTDSAAGRDSLLLSLKAAGATGPLFQLVSFDGPGVQPIGAARSSNSPRLIGVNSSDELVFIYRDGSGHLRLKPQLMSDASAFLK